MLGNLIVPARRHKCEVCNNIFECHICDIYFTHNIHSVISKTERYVFVCLKCADKNGWIGIVSRSGTKKYTNSILYDYRTGKVIRRFELHKRKYNLETWLKTFDIQKHEIKI